MFKYISQFVLSLMIIAALNACGGSENNEETGGNESGGKETEFLVVKSAGVGALDKGLAVKGKQIFDQKCAACHKYDQRLVGPALGDITKKRSPEYILSMITNPSAMIKNNDTAKQLFQQYMTEMANQNISLDDAKAIYHHLLEVSSK